MRGRGWEGSGGGSALPSSARAGPAAPSCPAPRRPLSCCRCWASQSPPPPRVSWPLAAPPPRPGSPGPERPPSRRPAETLHPLRGRGLQLDGHVALPCTRTPRAPVRPGVWSPPLLRVRWVPRERPRGGGRRGPESALRLPPCPHPRRRPHSRAGVPNGAN